ncbi:hypothetical protein SDC9_180156 [bioreactor metagenome]|uniref:UDP-N-acetylglucosamine 4-epimerase n=1 Tax=bioreactor metagenome TaxID=1076179 RepID=A0A645H2H1_9ZZZZ
MKKPPVPDENGAPHKLYNIGNSHPETLTDFVATLESCLTAAGVIRQPAQKEYLPIQPGDVLQTYADVSELERDFGFKPRTSLKDGLTAFAKWYKEYYKI